MWLRNSLPLACAFAALLAAPAATAKSQATQPKSEIDRVQSESFPKVRWCYLEHAEKRTAATTLQVDVTVDRDGDIIRSDVARLVKTKTASDDKPRHHPVDVAPELERCVTNIVHEWDLTPRAAATRYLVPYTFHHADRAHQAGPYPSCYDPDGC